MSSKRMIPRHFCDVAGYSRTNLVHVYHLLCRPIFPVTPGPILRVTAPNLTVNATARVLIGVFTSVTAYC